MPSIQRRYKDRVAAPTRQKSGPHQTAGGCIRFPFRKLEHSPYTHPRIQIMEHKQSIRLSHTNYRVDKHAHAKAA